MKQELEDYFINLMEDVGNCSCARCNRVRPLFPNKRELAKYLLKGDRYFEFSGTYTYLREDLTSFIASSNKSARHTFGDLLGGT